ncbi:MAG: chaperonin GroEL [Planctomycetota bacterium]
MAKQMVFETDAREAIQRGVEKLAKAVVTTLGPRGRNAILDKGWGAPTVTKDGVSVAEEIELANPYEQMGAALVKEVASKTSDVAGDGTTTATLLTASIFGAGMKALTAGAAPARLNQAIADGVAAVTAQLTKMARPVAGPSDIEQIATISANNDPEVGKLIAGAMKKVGQDGVITVEDGKSMTTEIEVVEGMQFDRGFLSPHFVTDPASMVCSFDKPLILVHEGKISAIQALLPLLEAVKKAGRKLLIIAEDIDSEPLATLVVNSCAASCRPAPSRPRVRRPPQADAARHRRPDRRHRDHEGLGLEFDKVGPQHLGTANSVHINSDSTTITSGRGKRDAVDERVALIRREIENTSSDYDREKLQERLAKLTGGIAQINVGGATDTEVKERKALIEDALHATRAAVADGVLPGGGTALLRRAACSTACA